MTMMLTIALQSISKQPAIPRELLLDLVGKDGAYGDLEKSQVKLLSGKVHHDACSLSGAVCATKNIARITQAGPRNASLSDDEIDDVLLLLLCNCYYRLVPCMIIGNAYANNNCPSSTDSVIVSL